MDSSELDTMEAACARLRVDPSLCDALPRLQCLVSCVEARAGAAARAPPGDDASDADEEPPPDFVEGEGCHAPQTPREHVQRARARLDGTEPGGAAAARADADAALAANPDYDRAYKVRAAARERLGDLAGAVADLAEGQRIDYDPDLYPTQKRWEAALAAQKKPGAASSAPPPPPSNSNGMANISMDQIASAMQDPQIMGMAQQLMQDPRAMQAMLRSFQGGASG